MTTGSHIFDVVIIGGGPGGYVAAIRARQLGLSVAVIEANHLGGICLNWGCIPTKALLKSSHLFHMAHNLAAFGISVSEISMNIMAMVQRSREVVTQLTRGVNGLLKKHGISIYSGFGKIEEVRKDQHLISISRDSKICEKIYGKHVIIATGARPRQLFAGQENIWSYKEAMMPEKIPQNLLIIGAGAIGVEFASFYNALGTKVTVVDQAQRVLPAEDKEIALIAQKEFCRQGMNFYFNHTLDDVSKNDDGQVIATLKNLETNQTTQWIGCNILVAIGVIGNTDNLGLENTRVKIDRGQITVKDYNQTDEPGIYAIGDVAGPPWLAHKASHEGVSCVEAIAGYAYHNVDKNLIPGCIFSSPQIASIGLTEEDAAAKTKIKIGKFPFAANGQALANGDTVGLVKVIFDKNTGELLGAHLIGQGVTELIQGFSIAKTLEATEEDLKRVIFPHPTLSEMIHEAVLDADDESLHIIK